MWVNERLITHPAGHLYFIAYLPPQKKRLLLLVLKKKLHDEQAGKQPKMSKQEQQRLKNTKMTGDDAHRYLRQGILTAEQNREIDFRDDFPRMESLEFKKIFAMTEGYA